MVSSFYFITVSYYIITITIVVILIVVDYAFTAISIITIIVITLLIRICDGLSVMWCSLELWLGEVLWERTATKEDVYRMKGVVNVHGSDNQHVFQAVHELYDVFVGAPWNEGKVRENRVVVIGRNLDKDKLTASFKQCMYSGP